jgi:hypothetical protein
MWQKMREIIKGRLFLHPGMEEMTKKENARDSSL